MFVARPRVADVVFRLHDRPVHPELFDALAVRRVRAADFDLSVRLTPAGHLIEWRRGGLYLAEVVASASDDLPADPAAEYRFGPERRHRWAAAGVKYQVSFSAEVLPPEVFAHVHDELAADGAKRGVVFHFAPHTRLGLAPLGLVTADAVPDGVAVAAFHTFPAEHTVLKTQSLIEPA